MGLFYPHRGEPLDCLGCGRPGGRLDADHDDRRNQRRHLRDPRRLLRATGRGRSAPDVHWERNRCGVLRGIHPGCFHGPAHGRTTRQLAGRSGSPTRVRVGGSLWCRGPLGYDRLQTHD